LPRSTEPRAWGAESEAGCRPAHLGFFYRAWGLQTPQRKIKKIENK